MSARLTGNEWGVDDAAMFAFILERTGVQPTFDVIMSTSYHPPFSVDLEAAGFDLEALRANPLCRGTLRAAAPRPRPSVVLGQESRRLRRSEAEHRARPPALRDDGRPLLARGVRQSAAEPLRVLGGALRPLRLARRSRSVRAPRGARGSHVDIVPTLVDLVAPAGFAYHAFGRDLLDPTAGAGRLRQRHRHRARLRAERAQPDARRGSRGPRSGPGRRRADLVRRYRQLHGPGLVARRERQRLARVA